MKSSSLRITGVFLLLLGILCLAYPVFSAFWAESFTAIVLAIAAVFTFALAGKESSYADKAIYAFMGIIYLAGCLFLVFNPVVGLTVMMAAFAVIFFCEGVFALALFARKSRHRNWLMLINALASFILAFLVFANVNEGVLFIGLLVGIDLIFTGIGLLFWSPAQNLNEA